MLNAIGIRRATIIARWIGSLFFVFLLVGCRSELFPRESRVDPAALNDVRSVGRVLTQATTDEYYDGTTTIDEFLVIDAGGSSAADALGKASEALRNRGWNVKIARIPESVYLVSSKWKEVRVVILAIDNRKSFDGNPVPEAKKAIDDARALTKSDTLLVAQVYNDEK